LELATRRQEADAPCHGGDPAARRIVRNTRWIGDVGLAG